MISSASFVNQTEPGPLKTPKKLMFDEPLYTRRLGLLCTPFEYTSPPGRLEGCHSSRFGDFQVEKKEPIETLVCSNDWPTKLNNQKKTSVICDPRIFSHSYRVYY